MPKKNYQKYLTALLYASETPIGVWAGFELGVGHYIFGIVLVVVMMGMEVSAVITWMNAQTIEIDADINKVRHKKRIIK
ncbi:MAG TPA: hypothetical protein VL944_02350 [Candidatus Acidoferrum sp.]|nr:hypothetical protein [Candidatus Acidoferrum sp.]